MNLPRSIGLAGLLLLTGLFAVPRFLRGWESLAGYWRYAFVVIGVSATLVFLYGMAARIRHWTAGPAPTRSVTSRALQRLLSLALLQQRVLREPIGRVHAAMFWAFVLLFVTFSLPLGILEGTVLRYAQGIFNAALCIGGGVLALRMLGVRHKRRQLEPGELAARLYPPALIAAIGASYFGAELGPGWTLLNFALVALFFASIPYTRLLHVLAVPLWLIVRPDEHVAVSVPFNLAHESAQDIVARDARLGPRTMSEFERPDRVGFDACTRCGRCEDACPAVDATTSFSPARVMKRLQEANRPRSDTAVTELAAGLALDACTSCARCVTACPVGLEPVSAILELRRSLAYAGRFAPGHTAALRHLAYEGVMWDASRNPPLRLSPPLAWPPDPAAEPPALIYWVGCAGRHEPRAQAIAQTVGRLLDRAGIRWTCAGDHETCTGDPARRLGDEGLFQRQALRVIELLRQARTRTVLVNCAHCFNVFLKHYPALGGHFEVVHHSEYFAALARSGRLGRLEALPRKLMFHDPCYLGRHTGRFDAPRAALGQIAGLTLEELPEARECSRCCGAGGGRMWREAEPGAAMAARRAQQAVDGGAEKLVTACPFCMVMLEHPASAQGVPTQDIAEVIAESLRE